jgi:hypothetical protein
MGICSDRQMMGVSPTKRMLLCEVFFGGGKIILLAGSKIPVCGEPGWETARDTIHGMIIYGGYSVCYYTSQDQAGQYRRRNS